MKLFAGALALFLSGVQPQTQQTSVPDRIEDIEVRGNIRVPDDTIRFSIQTKIGDVLDPELIQEDIRILYDLGYFDDIGVSQVDGQQGTIVIFEVREKPLIASIEYRGNNSFTPSEILERFRELEVDLGVTMPYEETSLRRAQLVIEDLLAEQGHPKATVEVETEDIPPSAIAIIFEIDEGPKIQIERIDVVGNDALCDREVKSAMLLKETGPVTSLKNEDIYQELKMSDDRTRIEMLYRENGYLRAVLLEPEIEIRPYKIHRTLPFIKPPFPWGIPLPFWKKEVDRLFITIPVEENDQYRVGEVHIVGNTLFDRADLLAALGLVRGEVYNETLLRNGFLTLTRMYGARGYINFTPIPVYDFDDANKVVHLTINFQEDRRFFVGQINFRGNTTTRDRVIRREMMVAEREVFNSELWELSMLRLNQLGYFEPITEEAVEIQPRPIEPVVDITLNVQEREGNFVGFTGGVSPIGGSYGGLNYSTNNFLGFGETLSVSAQGGTRQSNFTFNFSEPYLMNRPMSTGFSVFRTELRFDDSLNFDQSQTGFNVFASYPFKVFQRVGLLFEFDNSEISTPNAFFDDVRQTEGQSFGTGTGDFRTRSLIPTYRWSTLDSPNFPSSGQSIRASLQFSGGFLGGNVNTIQPSFEYQFFKPINGGRNTLAFRFQSAYLRGFSTTNAPFFRRFFLGGDFDIRGFDFRSISPIAFVTPQVVDSSTGQPTTTIAYVGGDTSAVANIEYRIPIAGDILTLVPFLDVGNSWVTRKSHLKRQVVQPDGTIGFEDVRFLPGTNSGLRASTGAELQIMIPLIRAPLRFIYAFNPLRLDRVVAAPSTGQQFFLRGKSREFKFTIGKTF